MKRRSFFGLLAALPWLGSKAEAAVEPVITFPAPPNDWGVITDGVIQSAWDSDCYELKAYPADVIRLRSLEGMEMSFDLPPEKMTEAWVDENPEVTKAWVENENPLLSSGYYYGWLFGTDGRAYIIDGRTQRDISWTVHDDVGLGVDCDLQGTISWYVGEQLVHRRRGRYSYTDLSVCGAQQHGY